MAKTKGKHEGKQRATVATRVTPKKRAAFAKALAETGSVTEAAKLAGMSRVHAYRLRESDPEFLAAWDDAVGQAMDGLEQEAIRRATQGFKEPVFHEGSVCGYKRRYSDTLLMFMLNGRRPNVFKNRTELSGEVGTVSRVIEIPSNGR